MSDQNKPAAAALVAASASNPPATDAFAQLDAKGASRKTAHVALEGKVVGNDLVINLPLSELAKATRGTGGRTGLGLSVSITFANNGKRYRLNCGWMGFSNTR